MAVGKIKVCQSDFLRKKVFVLAFFFMVYDVIVAKRERREGEKGRGGRQSL